MKLNPDCVRDVLVAIEELQIVNERGYLDRLRLTDLLTSPLVSAYREGDITYSVKQLSDCGFIQAASVRRMRSEGWLIEDITPAGHEFLQNTRDCTVWAQAKEKAKSAGSFALGVLSAAAASIISGRLGG